MIQELRLCVCDQRWPSHSPVADQRCVCVCVVINNWPLPGANVIFIINTSGLDSSLSFFTLDLSSKHLQRKREKDNQLTDYWRKIQSSVRDSIRFDSFAVFPASSRCRENETEGETESPLGTGHWSVNLGHSVFSFFQLVSSAVGQENVKRKVKKVKWERKRLKIMWSSSRAIDCVCSSSWLSKRRSIVALGKNDRFCLPIPSKLSLFLTHCQLSPSTTIYLDVTSRRSRTTGKSSQAVSGDSDDKWINETKSLAS